MGDFALATDELRLRMSLLVCFSGQIGSGKSSVSTAVAQALGWPRVSFGDYLRGELVRLGRDPTSRAALQELGQRLVEDDPDSFCQAVLRSGGVTPGADGVVDGVRHVSVYHALTRVAAPSMVLLIHLNISDASQVERVSQRHDRDDLARASRHAVEAELQDSLPRSADLTVDANEPVEVVTAECLKVIARWR